MFEKEAEEYATENWEYYEEGKNDSKELKQAYQQGAQFGYNKCKEELNQNGLALQSDMDKTIEQNIALKKENAELKTKKIPQLEGTLRSKTMEIEKIEQNLKEVKRTERGWAGHFCCSSSCKFRRNTLLECDDIQIVVSTVGAMYNDKGKLEEIGLNRHYETMAFLVDKSTGPYKDADFSKEVAFESNGALKWHKKGYIDNEANEMHEAVVNELTRILEQGKKLCLI